MAKMLRAALYTRVSTDIQARKEEGSLETQEQRLRSYASIKGNIEVTRIFREEGRSGGTLDRPQLQTLLAEVNKKNVDVIMVTRLDRLSRSMFDFLQLHRTLEEHGVELLCLNPTIDTSSPSGRFFLRTILNFAEFEREQIGERTRNAMKARAERGLWNGGQPPLGYDTAPGGHLLVNEDEAEVVRIIFDKYTELRSTPKLVRWVNDSGYRRKEFTSRRKGKQGPKPFTRDTLLGMLKNPLYIGKVTHKGDIYEGKHNGIVELKVFKHVQFIVDSNRKGKKRPPLKAMHDYLLVGVARCNCGYALTATAGTSRTGKVYPYHRCVGLRTQDRHECTVRQVRGERLEEAVIGVMRKAATDPKLLKGALDKANRLAEDELKPLQRHVAALRKQLKDVEGEGQQTLKSIISAGVKDNDFAKAMLTDLEVRRDALQAELFDSEAKLAVTETEQLDLDLVTKNLQAFDAVFDELDVTEKRELIQLMIHQAVVHKDRVEVDLFDGRHAQSILDTKSTNPSVVFTEGFVRDRKWLPVRLLM